MYVKEDPCHTMACMVDMGLVDLDNPEESTVLIQILKAEPESELITEDVIGKEYQAFLQWITYSASCHVLECGVIENPCGGAGPIGGPPDDVLTPLGSCSQEALVGAFTTFFMAWDGRCLGCHSDCDDDFEAPCWLVEGYSKEKPEEVYTASLVTMYNLIGMGAVNVEEPDQSLMILKPLAKKLGGLWHGGGDKFNGFADEAYQDFMLWLDAYSSCFYGLVPQKPLVKMISPQ